MAIEKMALVSVEGPLRKVNKTLINCCESNCFHIVHSNHNNMSDIGSSDRIKTLKDKNVYASLLKRGIALAEGLGIKLINTEYTDIDYNAGIDFVQYFSGIEEKYNKLNDEKTEATDQIDQYRHCLAQVEHLDGFNVNFQDIFALKYVKVRFGKLPNDSYEKLSYYADKDFMFFPFEGDKDYVWGVYFTPDVSSLGVDEIFKSLYFERTRLPDFLNGNADEAKVNVAKSIKQNKARIKEIDAQLAELCDAECTHFQHVINKLKALDGSHELRSNVSVINGQFLLMGFVPKRELSRFTDSIKKIDGVTATEKPLDSEPLLTPPVKLRNNWLFRPFEMFVNMYGLPNYKGIDPTPYVAITYMIIFGIMFGDLGQGICIALFGILLDRWKHVKLAPIMTRIGVFSAFFGTLYGSVFGNEEVIAPFFHLKPVYTALGYSSPPENIFQISSLLLIAAMAIGVVLILISMCINIGLSFKEKNWGDALFGANGIAGLVFYASVIIGAALQLGLGITMFTTPYVLCLIILPLIIMFFKEPLSEFIKNSTRKTAAMKKTKTEQLVDTVSEYSLRNSDLERVFGNDGNIENILNSKYIKVQYGHLPSSSYEKLEKYVSNNYFFFPFDDDGEKIDGVYITTMSEAPYVDKTFSELGFNVEKMPDKINHDSTKKEKGENKEKKSIGNFIIEGIIELFESSLSYVTNTMSFLRIGGFILSHAGLMLVVNILAQQVGGGVGAIIVEICGNIFVIGMEGFLVGIQVLRLEFYEIFSRFYKSDGEPFNPIVLDFDLKQIN